MPADRVRYLAATLLALSLLACSPANERSPDIVLADGWAREIAPGQSAAAVYLAIINRGEGGDRLVAATSPAASSATLHASASAGGVARMRPIEDGVAVPARSRIELKPGGTHIMLGGLKHDLEAGETIGINLRFDRSGQRSIAIRIVPATARDGGTGHGMRM